MFPEPLYVKQDNKEGKYNNRQIEINGEYYIDGKRFKELKTNQRTDTYSIKIYN